MLLTNLNALSGLSYLSPAAVVFNRIAETLYKLAAFTVIYWPA
jgi:hypothetical protein